jgi:hypothetical protein
MISFNPTVALQPDAKPRISEFLNQEKGILPAGIYSGGSVNPGPGLKALAIQPFSAKAYDGFTVTTTVVSSIDFEGISLAADTLFYLVLYAKAWVSGDPTAEHTVRLQLFSATDWLTFGDKLYCIKLATILVPQTGSSIPAANIDCGAADRIDLAQSKVRIFSGSSQLNGLQGATVYHNLGTLDYRGFAQPVVAPNLGYGDIWIDKQANSMTVYCSSVAEFGSFDWFVVLNRGVSDQTPYGLSVAYANLANVLPNHFGASIVQQDFLNAQPITQARLNLLLQSVIDPQDSWGIQANQDVSVKWQHIQASLNYILVDVDVAGNSGVYDLVNSLPTASYKAFAIPQFAATKLPVIVRTNNSVTIRGDNGRYRLIIVKNAGAHPTGIMSNITNSCLVEHNFNLQNYVPLIALVPNSDASIPNLSSYALNIEANTFNLVAGNSNQFSIEWMIL